LESGVNTLLVVGDSLAYEAEPYLGEELPGWEIRSHTGPGKKIAQGLADLEAAPAADVLAISLGTNDDPWEPDVFRSAIERVLSKAGPDGHVVWPDIVSPPRDGVSYDALNETLAEAARSEPRLVIVDWSGLVRANPSWLDEDGIHVSDDGYRARARAVADAVRTCRG
jgi:lysophospholipase L1-like esterase